MPVLTPARATDPDFLDALRDLAPDACPVVAYGNLLPPVALDVPRLGWVNLHFSVLPAWRGAAPVQHAIMAGDTVTGASTFLIERGPRHRPRLRRHDRDDPTRRHRGHPARPARDRRGRAARRHARRARDRRPRAAAHSRATASRSRPRSRSTTPASGGPTPPSAVDRRVRGCTPAPGAWTDLPRSAAQGRARDARRPTSRPPPSGQLAPGTLLVTKQAVPRRHRHRARAARHGAGARQEADGGRRLGARHAHRGRRAGRR